MPRNWSEIRDKVVEAVVSAKRQTLPWTSADHECSPVCAKEVFNSVLLEKTVESDESVRDFNVDPERRSVTESFASRSKRDSHFQSMKRS